MRTDRGRRTVGFTLIEILLAIMVISALGSVGYMTAKAVQQNVKDRKLESDVAAANAAIQLYKANGGTIAPTASANDVVTQLKTRADSSSTAKTVGLTGSFLDVRAEPVWQTSAEAASGGLRASWDGVAGVFVLSNSGDVGIKEFQINSANAAATPSVESRVPTKDAATQTKWVWDYTNPTNNVLRVGITPGTVASGSTTSTGTANYQTQLAAPTIAPAGGAFPLISFDIPVTITNPNPAGTSQIYYSAGGTWSLYTGGINVAPGATVQAVAVTLNPNSYVNSQSATPQTYTATPVTLAISLTNPAASLTYAQAGGVMTSGATQTPSPVTISLTSASQIPSKYITSAKFQTYYTRDGSNPLTSNTATAGPSFSGSFTSPSIAVSLSNWGSASSLTVSAAAKAIDTAMFASSSVVTATIGITTTVLASPTITPASGIRSTDTAISIALASGQTYPVGARIYYTTDGSDPGNTNGNPSSGLLYSGTFLPTIPSNGILVVTSRVYGPSNYGQWFTPSSTAIATYTSPSGNPDGALVGNATVNGTFVGSLIYTNQLSNLPANIAFNSSARITQGNVYFPGTPTFNFNGSMNTIIQGRQFSSDGVETLPNTDTTRVVDLTGSTLPTNYNVTFNSGAIIQGKVYRRYTPPTMPTVSAPGSPSNSNTYTLNSGTVTINPASNANLNINSGTATLLPGNYGSLNVGGTIVLGTVGGVTPTVYNFQTMNLNSNSKLLVVGPVILTMQNGLNVNTAIMGSSTNPDWLQLNMYAGDFTMNSGAQVYGKVVAPNNTVNLNGTFNGSVAAKSLSINGNGIALTLPPVVSGG